MPSSLVVIIELMFQAIYGPQTCKKFFGKKSLNVPDVKLFLNFVFFVFFDADAISFSLLNLE